ncbi:MAG: hypothetical protein KF851_19960 [Pirellulaceae bacterium]|nr:hypothetical protein [Pirellulaceae bacterium]
MKATVSLQHQTRASQVGALTNLVRICILHLGETPVYLLANAATVGGQWMVLP